ncbi:MAG: site-specific integrase [Nostoc sp. JL31]|uniref:tyrosine-type recombinase/integrase n=1 Tax=Nostoc sp. JL31 TaxID=2815395 RepID=UPI0025EE7C98|nr:site-specific integrase [Nostoc sp. JL31]MBN3891044.1 site-specific integrase [Nostoc sp. JL31]
MGIFHNHRPSGSRICAYSVATKVFGEELVNQACDRILEAYLELGYGKDRAKVRMLGCICDLLLKNRSPYIEDLTIEIFKSLRNDDNLPVYIRRDLLPTSCALTSLGIITEPLTSRVKEGERFGNHDATENVPQIWLEYCRRWYDTSTLSPRTRQTDYYQLLKIGRWLFKKHPDIISPEKWTRDLAIEFIADVVKMKVGEWADATKMYEKNLGKPLSPRSKNALIGTARRFFIDCQEWGWIKRHFSPERAFATPRSIKGLISPNPRVISDDIWAKLLWAGLNFTEEDLPHSQYQDLSNRVPWYPLEMVKAIVIVWLFAGLRSDEIYRLRVGCVRWQKNDVIIPGTNQLVSKDAVCYLDIPVHKTGTAYTKPVDRLVGEAIEEWEKFRPNQPPIIDHKDGSIAHYLFFYRGRKVGKAYINHSVIPMLCKKANAPETDARGNITSHRARSTIASQLANAKDPMTLLELKEWLGHRDVGSTINYTKVSPTKLAKSYQDAEYFKRNLRTIEVLIDQDAVKNGASSNGEAWKFYDLGHGYCSYDFFDQCKHRMACAKCSFYIPKDSSKAQILESKTNLQRMLQEIPLTEEERAAVEEGIEAMSMLSAKLTDEPTPSGQTPRELGNV